MAFGKQSGPPAPMKQVQYLLSLIQQAGHSDFRDARGALGLTQRQATGKFSVGEASELIEQLELAQNERDEATDAGTHPIEAPLRAVKLARDASAAESRLRREREQAMKGLPAEVLADELVSRGWVVIPPTQGTVG